MKSSPRWRNTAVTSSPDQQASFILIGSKIGEALAVGTPVVALFGPSNPAEWGPRGGPAKVLYKGPDCRVCFHPTCHRGEESCMRLIAVDEVMSAVERLLEEIRAVVR